MKISKWLIGFIFYSIVGSAQTDAIEKIVVNFDQSLGSTSYYQFESGVIFLKQFYACGSEPPGTPCLPVLELPPSPPGFATAVVDNRDTRLIEFFPCSNCASSFPKAVSFKIANWMQPNPDHPMTTTRLIAYDETGNILGRSFNPLNVLNSIAVGSPENLEYIYDMSGLQEITMGPYPGGRTIARINYEMIDPNASGAGIAMDDLVVDYEPTFRSCRVGDFGRQVPHFQQTDDSWSRDIYDHSTKTMGALGCATSSLAMVAKSYGLNVDAQGRPLNPGTLNEGLKNFNSPEVDKNYIGYTSSGAVHWQGALLYARSAFTNECLRLGGQLDECVAIARNSGAFKGIFEGNNFSYELVENEICNGNPVILHVPSKTEPNNPAKSHFVVAVETEIDEYGEKSFNVRDPGVDAPTSLISYNEIRGARLFRPHRDPTMIFVYSDNGLDFVVTDPLGRKTGKDSLSGSTFNEIPGAIYLVEPGIADLDLSDGKDDSTKPQIVFQNLEAPLSGSYQIQASGQATSQYGIQFYGFDDNGDPNSIIRKEGVLPQDGRLSIPIHHTNAPLIEESVPFRLQQAAIRRGKNGGSAVGFVGRISLGKNVELRAITKNVIVELGNNKFVIPPSSIEQVGRGKSFRFRTRKDSGQPISFEISKHGQFEIRGNSLDLPSTSKFNLMIKLRVEDRIGQDEIRFKCKGKGKICFGR